MPNNNNNQVIFNSEGLIVSGDPCLEKIGFCWTTISFAAEIWGGHYGSIEEAVVTLGSKDEFSRLDRGSLLRIAKATERSANSAEMTSKAIENLNKNMVKLIVIFEKLKKWTEERNQEQD